MYHNFYLLLVATKWLTAKLRLRYVNESESGVGHFEKVGHFTSYSAALVKSIVKKQMFVFFI